MSTTIPQWTTADRLVKARESAGLKPGDMKARLGVSAKTIWNWEHGRHIPRTALIAWAQVTNVPLWWLEGRDEEDAATTKWCSASSIADAFESWLASTPAPMLTLAGYG